MFPIRIPNPMGISNIGSNSYFTARKIKKIPIKIMAICPISTLANPVFSQNIKRFSLNDNNIFICNLFLSYYKQLISFENSCTFFSYNFSNSTIGRCLNIVFHLHCFKHHNGITSFNGVTHAYFHLQYRTG